MDKFNPNSRGLVFVSCGALFDRLTAHSVNHLRKYSDLPVHVVTNIIPEKRNELWSIIDGVTFQYVKRIPVIDKTKKANRIIKTSLYTYSPFNETLYMDSDALICSAEFIRLFDLLKKMDMGFPLMGKGWHKGIAKFLDQHFVSRIKNRKICRWQGCICLFKKNNKTKIFFKTWNRLWNIRKKQDMPPLLCASYLHPEVQIADLSKHKVATFEAISPYVADSVIKHFSCSINRFRNYYNETVGKKVW